MKFLILLALIVVAAAVPYVPSVSYGYGSKAWGTPYAGYGYGLGYGNNWNGYGNGYGIGYGNNWNNGYGNHWGGYGLGNGWNNNYYGSYKAAPVHGYGHGYNRWGGYGVGLGGYRGAYNGWY